MSAGSSVNEATMPVSIPMAQGNPALRSMPTCAKSRQDRAAAIVSPEAAITGATDLLAMTSACSWSTPERRCS
ncbi:Uncharacterised protein [Mycobacteroides abscessus subsp. abscessus]|nr:Uncharacterised protein [Mycobacteroides abscessus subsp. abscessus]